MLKPLVRYDGEFIVTVDGRHFYHVYDGEDQRRILKDLKQNVKGKWDTNVFESSALKGLFFDKNRVVEEYNNYGVSVPEWFASKYSVTVFC